MLGATVKLADGNAYLLYNGLAALRFDGEGEAVSRIFENSPEGEKMLVNLASALAEGGELARRHLGYDSQKIPTAEDFLKFGNIAALRAVVMAAILSSVYIDGAAAEEEDLSLAEFEAAHKAAHKTLDNITELAAYAASNGVSVKETLLLPLGSLQSVAEKLAEMRAQRWPTM